MLRPLQKFLNFSEIKLLPASDTILQGMPYSPNMIFTAAIRLSADKPLHSFYYWELAMVINNAYVFLLLSWNMSLLILHPKVSLGCHGVWSSLWAAFA